MKAWILKIQKKKKKDSTQNYKRLIWKKDTLNEKEITPNILFNVSRKHQKKKKKKDSTQNSTKNNNMDTLN